MFVMPDADDDFSDSFFLRFKKNIIVIIREFFLISRIFFSGFYINNSVFKEIEFVPKKPC